MRSARSPLLKEAGDLSSALTDADGRLVAQGRDIPMHMGVMGFTVKEFLRRVPRDQLREGDVWFVNLPEVGGNHLPNVKAVRPVFAGGGGDRLRHQPRALGGHRRGGAGQLRALGHRVLPGGGADLARAPVQRGGTRPGRKIELILGQRAGARGAGRGHVRAVRRQRRGRAPSGRADRPPRRGDPPGHASSRLHAESEAQMRAAIRALPDGDVGRRGLAKRRGVQGRPHSHPGARHHPGRRGPLRLHRNRRGRRAGPVNTTPFIACSSVYYAMKALVAPDVPPNDGCYRPLHVTVPPLLGAESRRRPPGGGRQSRDVPAGRRRHLRRP